jgi:hypothetical protein
MPTNNGGLLTKEQAKQARDRWIALLPTSELSTAFRFVERGETKNATSFELSTAGIAAIFQPLVTSIRLYPATGDSAGLGRFFPLIRGLIEHTDTVKFTDYYRLNPVTVGSSKSLAKGTNSEALRMQEIDAARRERYRQDWNKLNTDGIRAAFRNGQEEWLKFYHFDSRTATKESENHIGRLIALAAQEGAAPRFFLHLGWDVVSNDTDFGYKSVLEMQDASGQSLNFQFGMPCPSFCHPPQED